MTPLLQSIDIRLQILLDIEHVNGREMLLRTYSLIYLEKIRKYNLDRPLINGQCQNKTSLSDY